MAQITSLLVLFGALLALGVIATATGLLLFAGRISVGIRGYVATEVERAKYEEEIVTMLREFIEVQRQTNEQLWTALDVHSDRLNRWTGKRRRGAGER